MQSDHFNLQYEELNAKMGSQESNQHDLLAQDSEMSNPRTAVVSRGSDPDSIKNESDDASMCSLLTELEGSSDISDNSNSSGDEGQETSMEVGQEFYNHFARMLDHVVGDEDDEDDDGSDGSDGDEESSNDGEIDVPGDPLELIIQRRQERLTRAEVPNNVYVATPNERENQGEDKAEKGTSTLPAGVKSFAKLQKDSFPSNSFELKQSYEQGRWHMLELEEIKQEVERQLEEAGKKQDDLISELTGRHDRFFQMVNDRGISMELWDAYQAFCESMEPEFGSRNGWSITCESDHGGSYVEYDPTFALLKEHSELPWSQHNFRCEPTVDPSQFANCLPAREVVEFWPVKNLESDIEHASTWGDLYPVLYDQATAAIRNGSEAAMGMLIALPDQHASFEGGWLFEYFPTNGWTATRDTDGNVRVVVSGDGFTETNPPQSRRWTYRSAHNIAAPEDPAAKRQKIKQSLKPTPVFLQPANVLV